MWLARAALFPNRAAENRHKKYEAIWVNVVLALTKCG
jgi:hypothetical protein